MISYPISTLDNRVFAMFWSLELLPKNDIVAQCVALSYPAVYHPGPTKLSVILDRLRLEPAFSDARVARLLVD